MRSRLNMLFDALLPVLATLAALGVGAVMLLETGGEARFQLRPVEGVELPPGCSPELLILDGQQRLTILTQVLALKTASSRSTSRAVNTPPMTPCA